MAGLDEAGGSQETNVKASLDSGVDVASNFQVITFTQYVRLVLPLDGFVFWVRADILSESALLNALKLNAATPNAPEMEAIPAKKLTIGGDLHYATTNSQDEATAFSTDRVVFTSKTEVQDLNAVGSNILYLGEIDGIQFAFSSRGYFQENAHLYHYVGNAVYADLASQIVDDPATFDARSVVVSNSLPIWLAMNGYVPQDWEPFGNQSLTLYPSFLLPNNIVPPYAAVHIIPDSTRALASAPTLDRTYGHFQLTAEKVRITLYGQRNFNGQDFVDFVMQQSLNNEDFGIMNLPILRDEKRTQVELNAIAMKKTVEFEINYLQTRLRNIARQLILEAIPTYHPTDFVAG